MRVFRLLLAGGLLFATACPPSGTEQKKADPSTTACTKVGQSCEVSPGKLGTCVQKDECNQPNGCFVCQSQH